MAATTDEQEPEQRTATTKRFFRPLSSALAVKFRSISPWRRRPWVIDQHCPGRKGDDAEAHADCRRETALAGLVASKRSGQVVHGQVPMESASKLTIQVGNSYRVRRL